MIKKDEVSITFGEKLKSARKRAGLTQEQPAEQLLVSRQVDSGEPMDLSVMREEIHLEDYTYTRTVKGRLNKKAGKKDTIVKEKYPNAEIHYLMGKQIPTKAEKITDNLIGFLTDAPFGIPDILNGFKNADKEFYLVNQSDKQFFVIVTDEFIESRQLSKSITDKKFSIGNFSFVNCGILPRLEDSKK